MLVISRKNGESIIIKNGNESIEVTIEKSKKNGNLHLCVDAPKKYKIYRKELLDATLK